MSEGTVLSINISTKKGTKKTPVDSAYINIKGIEKDAHTGDWHRQVSLLSLSSVEKMRNKGVDVSPGDFAENITVEGMEVFKLKKGEKIKVGEEVLLEVTQIGKECHSRCEIFKQVGDCVMPREGIFTRVLKVGMIKTGDIIKKTL